MHIVFVHGWSVRNTDTYGALPQYLDQVAAGENRKSIIANVFLGKYVSFEDTVNIDDIARAFNTALRAHPLLSIAIERGEKFACITHSTGAPVVRQWFHRYFSKAGTQCPMSHLIMLAPANHGSALAQLGKGRLSRIKSFFHGVAPGQRILDWLELGSDESWTLNSQWMNHKLISQGVYPFVLHGQSIDRSMYDVLNSYTDEAGSDGVVRAAAANLNYSYLKLTQSGDRLALAKLESSQKTAFAVLPGLSHSGAEMGIIKSVKLGNADQHPTVKAVLECLSAKTSEDYARIVTRFEDLTAATQTQELVVKKRLRGFEREFITPRCTMIVFKIVDDTDLPITDYDLIFTAGPRYHEYALPPGFFIDRQRNQLNPGKLTYYLNHDVLCEGLETRLEKKFGLKITARPTSGLSHYAPAEFQGDGDDIVKVIRANQTLMVEIVMQRRVDRQIFTITEKLGEGEPISDKPQNSIIPSRSPP